MQFLKDRGRTGPKPQSLPCFPRAKYILQISPTHSDLPPTLCTVTGRKGQKGGTGKTESVAEGERRLPNRPPTGEPEYNIEDLQRTADLAIALYDEGDRLPGLARHHRHRAADPVGRAAPTRRL